jgi:hypothetical protein
MSFGAVFTTTACLHSSKKSYSIANLPRSAVGLRLNQ